MFSTGLVSASLFTFFGFFKRKFACFCVSGQSTLLCTFGHFLHKFYPLSHTSAVIFRFSLSILTLKLTIDFLVLCLTWLFRLRTKNYMRKKNNSKFSSHIFDFALWFIICMAYSLSWRLCLFWGSVYQLISQNIRLLLGF